MISWNKISCKTLNQSWNKRLLLEFRSKSTTRGKRYNEYHNRKIEYWDGVEPTKKLKISDATVLADMFEKSMSQRR